MMISSPTAGAPNLASAALDRAAAPAVSGGPQDGSGDAAPDGGPDVVVTLGGGRANTASTYDATGRLPGGPSLDDLGANGPASLAQATETLSAPADDGAPDAPDAPAPEDAVPA